jgi:hypothetical protein
MCPVVLCEILHLSTCAQILMLPQRNLRSLLPSHLLFQSLFCVMSTSRLVALKLIAVRNTSLFSF